MDDQEVNSTDNTEGLESGPKRVLEPLNSDYWQLPYIGSYVEASQERVRNIEIERAAHEERSNKRWEIVVAASGLIFLAIFFCLVSWLLFFALPAIEKVYIKIEAERLLEKRRCRQCENGWNKFTNSRCGYCNGDGWL